MKIKTWYVTMQQKEIEAFNNAYERLVYEAVKSFCGNGKVEAEASSSEIATRATVSKMTVGRYLPKLIKRGFVKVTGKINRVGGSVNKYAVFPEIVESVANSDTSKEKSVTLGSKSVTPGCESVTDTGINPSNIKKKKIHTFSYKRQKQSDMAGFSPEIKDRLFGYAEALSMKGRLP